jgi:hypothetical protein
MTKSKKTESPTRNVGFDVGDLVRIRKAPRFLSHPEITQIVGQLGVIIERGSHENRWVVYCEGKRVSLHTNHIESPQASE